MKEKASIKYLNKANFKVSLAFGVQPLLIYSVQILLLKSISRNNEHLCLSASGCKPASAHVAGHDWQVPTHDDPIYYKAA